MPSTAAIKGSAFSKVVEDVAKLLARQTLSRSEAARRLAPEYLRERGRQTAQRLLEQGLYAQLEYLQRTEVSKVEAESARFAAFGRDLRLLTTLSASILSFSKWAARPDPDHERRYLIEVSDARDFPEVLCWTSDGFVNQMAAHHRRGDDLWSWQRARADLIVFRMTREP